MKENAEKLKSNFIVKRVGSQPAVERAESLDKSIEQPIIIKAEKLTEIQKGRKSRNPLLNDESKHTFQGS